MQAHEAQPYTQGFRKPSAGLPFEIRRSLSSDNAYHDRQLVVSWLEDRTGDLDMKEGAGFGKLLVVWQRKVVREAFAGEARCDLQVVTRRSVYRGTCEGVATW
jgi:hypothetical protein